MNASNINILFKNRFTLTILIIAVLLSFCSCKTPVKKTKGKDLVAIAEKTKPMRAVSESEKTESSTDTGNGFGNMPMNAMDDFVLARVDGEPIVYGEVQNSAIEKVGRVKWKTLSKKEQKAVFAASFQGMVARKLILAEAQTEGYNITDDRILAFIKSEIPEINQKFGGDVSKYAEFKKIDYDKFIKTIKEDMIYDVYLRTKIFPKDNVSPNDIREYYESNPSEFYMEASTHLYAITLYKKGDAKQNAEVLEKAKDILSKIEDGQDFEKLAKENTEDIEKRDQGGDWGWVKKDYFASEEINKEISILKPGEHSAIIETSVAYWIVKVIGKKADNTRKIEEVWKEIESAIRKNRINEAMAAAIEKLRKKHNIVIHNVAPAGE